VSVRGLLLRFSLGPPRLVSKCLPKPGLQLTVTSGIQNIYMQNFKCKVVGSTSTKGLGEPKAPVWCGDDPSKCVKGPKQLVVWHQKTGNNVFPPSGATPTYNGKMGFNPGAQTDIFVGDEGITPPPAVIPKAASYLGCFPDSGNFRALSVTPQIGESMTPEVCLQKCTAIGYKYAGLEDGHECWCGETAPAASSKVAESKCSKQCTGSVQTCGAPNFIEIYSTGVTTPLSPPPAPPASWSTAGCYYDPVTPRALPNKQQISGPVTIANCLAACENFAYAGLEFGQECYCGMTIAGVQQAPDTDCNIPCAGNSPSPAMCGGGGRLNVYSHVPGSSQTSTSAIPTTLKTSTTSRPASSLSKSVISLFSTSSVATTSSSTTSSKTISSSSSLPTPTPTTVSMVCPRFPNTTRHMLTP